MWKAVAKLQSWSCNKIILWSGRGGVTTAWGCSTRKVENHCSIWNLWSNAFLGLRAYGAQGEGVRIPMETLPSHVLVTVALSAVDESFHTLCPFCSHFPTTLWSRSCRWASIYKSQDVVLYAGRQWLLSSLVIGGKNLPDLAFSEWERFGLCVPSLIWNQTLFDIYEKLLLMFSKHPLKIKLYHLRRWPGRNT